MSESCDPNWDFSSLVINQLISLCSFVFSHPLYFSYLIFFAPYLLRLISFLSPLFLTTSLLSLAFLTAFVHDDNFYYTVVEILRRKKDHPVEEFQSFDDLGMYETLFGSSVMEERQSSFSEEKPEELEDLAVDKVELNSISGKKTQMEEKRMENFLKILDEFERMASNVEEKKRPDPKPDKVVEKQKAEESLSISNGSDAINGAKSHSQRITSEEREGGGERKLKAESSRALMAVNSYGSMRREEKEWKRTLACKLFEERHNVDGGEGMDSLWEAYEIDSTKQKSETNNNNKKKKMKTKKFIEKYEEEEEEDEVEGPLCCLQALKLSTGKMNLGVGIPNLVKISKAIKGIGWLHSVSKHSKKVHNNTGDRY